MKKSLIYFTLLFSLTKTYSQTWVSYDISNSPIASNVTQRINVDPLNSTIHISTNAGLNVKSQNTWALHSVNSGALSSNLALITLRDGSNLWVTTDGGGVSLFNGTSWTKYNTSNSNIPDDRVYDVVKSPTDGLIWFGTRDNGLTKFNGGTFTTISISGHVSANYNRAHSLAFDNNGILWIGTAGGGLAKYNPTTNSWTQYTTYNSTIPHNDVYTVKVGPDGKIWAGTFGGLALFNPQTNQFTNVLTSSNSLLGYNYIRGICFDNSGRAYLATGYGGVSRVETNYTINKTWKSSNSTLPTDTVWHIAYGDGKVWAATFTEGAAYLDVQQNTPQNVVLSGPQVLCQGQSGNISVSGYLSGSTFLWSASSPSAITGSNTGSSITATPSANTTYSCIITSPNGYSQTETFVINLLSSPIIASINFIQNIANYGESTGSASISASGGVPPYSYSWLPDGGPANSINNKPAGTYTCTITDANGCSTNQTVTLTQPYIDLTNSPKCSLLPGSLLTDGDDEEHLYQWFGSSDKYRGKLLFRKSRDGGSSNTFHNLCDNNGPTLVLIKNATTNEVFGGFNPSSWNADAGWTGGENGFIFNLTHNYKLNAAGNTDLANNEWRIGPRFGDTDINIGMSDLSEGSTEASSTYQNPQIKGYGFLSGQRNFPVAEIEVYSLVPSEIMASGPTTFCSGDSVTLSVKDGDSYHWSNGANTPAIKVKESGNYSVTLTFPGPGCPSLSFNKDVLVDQPFNLSASYSNASSPNSNDASVTLSPQGGTQPYSYHSDALSFSGNEIDPFLFSYWSADYYDNKGFSLQNGVVSQKTLSEGVSFFQTNHTYNRQPGKVFQGKFLCEPYIQAYIGFQKKFLNNMDVSNSLPEDRFAHALCVGNGKIRVSGSNSFLSLLDNTWYDFRIELKNQGANYFFKKETDSTWIQLISSDSGYDNNSTSNLYFGFTTINLRGEDRYEERYFHTKNWIWTGDSFNPPLTGLSTGTHTFTMLDALGCTATTQITISALSISGTDNLCPGQTGNISISGYAPGSTFSWSASSPFAITGSATGNSITTSPSVTTTYSCVITSSSGNTQTETFTVTVNPLPVITASNTGTYCTGQTISLSASGGNTYSWFGPSGFSASVQNPTRSGATTAMGGTYTVTATNTAGCSASATTMVTINSLLTVTASNSGPICTGTTINLSSSGGNTYSWTGPNNFSSSSQNPVITNATGSMSGTYTVTATNTLSGCSNSTTTNVTIYPNPTGIITGTSTICEGSSTQLSATAIGGAGAAVSGYQWQFNNVNIPGATSSSFNATQNGYYNVVVTNPQHCSSTINGFNLTVIPRPVVTATNTGAYCTGQAISLSASGGNTYSWSGPSGFSASVQNPTRSGATTAMSGTYTVKAINTSGCSASATTMVIVNPLPLVTASDSGSSCPGNNLYLYSSGGNAYSWTGPSSFNSNEQNPVLTNASAANSGTYTVTATNMATGCSASASTLVSILDTLPPVALTQNITLYLDSAGQASINPEQINNGSSDNCGIAQMTLDVSSFDCSSTGINTVILTITDLSGNIDTATAQVTVKDNRAPVVITQNLSLSLDPGGNAHIIAQQVNNGSYDNCGIATLSAHPLHFDCSNLGDNTVDVTITDLNGNIATGTAVVTITDNIKPMVLCNKGLELILNDTGIAVLTAVQLNGASSDNCGIASLAIDKQQFDCSNTGPNIVTLTVTDYSGNSATCTSKVLVYDTLPPTVIAKPVTVYLDSNGHAAITTDQVNNGSYDACGIDSLSLSATTFSCNQTGNNTVVFSVTDINGNTASTPVIITVIDSIAPDFNVHNFVLPLDANGQAVLAPGQLISGYPADACGIASMVLNKTDFSCDDIGNQQVVLNVIDNNGNTHSATATVSVQDNVAPTVLTQNIIVYLDASGQAGVNASQIDNGSYDACGIANMVLNKSVFTCSDLGTNTVILSAVDKNGNAASAQATITVKDNIAPLALCKNENISLVNGTASITAAQVNNGSTDNCGIASISVSPSVFNCSNIGPNIVTLTVKDNSGNMSSCQAVVNVNGTSNTGSCTIALSHTGCNNSNTGGDLTKLYLGYGPEKIKLTCNFSGNGNWTYNWSGSSYLSSANGKNVNFEPKQAGTYTITCTASKNNGCPRSCSVEICVKDVRVPDKCNKVYLCHVPNGNNSNPQTLIVNKDAVSSHLNHHNNDQLGTCSMICGANAKMENAAELFAQETSLGEVNLLVFPNPSSGNFNFQLETESDELVTIRIYDISGRLILTQNNLQPSGIISLGAELENGLFIAEVVQGEFIKSVKLTKLE